MLLIEPSDDAWTHRDGWGSRRVVAFIVTGRRSGLRIAASARDRASGDDLRDRFERNRTVAQHDRAGIVERNDGGFEAVFAATTIHDEVDAISQIVGDVLRRRWADATEPVRAGRGQGHLSRGDDGRRNRVRWTTHCNIRETTRHGSREIRMSRHDQRERAGPEALRQLAGHVWEPAIHHAVEHGETIDVHDERVRSRAFLGIEDPLHRSVVERIACQPVDRLGGDGDDLASAQRSADSFENLRSFGIRFSSVGGDGEHLGARRIGHA